jgi:hypothetical protein
VRSHDSDGFRHESNLATLTKIMDGPAIDGVEDDVWRQGAWNPIDNLISGKLDGPADGGGEWKGLWTSTHFYLFVRVRDDKKLMDSPGHSYRDDQIELFITSDDRKPPSYFRPRNTNTFAYENPRGGPTTETHKKTTGYRSAYAEVAGGWTLELAVPFSDWGISPSAGHRIGIDMNINDDDEAGDDGKNDAQIGWNGRVCCVGADPTLQGSARLGD